MPDEKTYNEGVEDGFEAANRHLSAFPCRVGQRRCKDLDGSICRACGESIYSIDDCGPILKKKPIEKREKTIMDNYPAGFTDNYDNEAYRIAKQEISEICLDAMKEAISGVTGIFAKDPVVLKLNAAIKELED